MQALLEARDLCVHYRDATGGVRPALDGLNLEILPGETLGILGESGCGKSTLAMALLRLLPPGGCVSRGSILFDGRNILEQSERELETIRGARISLIFQEPSLALHPTMRIGEQISQILGAHESFDPRTRRQKTLHVLAQIFPSDVERIFSSYPHQLSGGQRQRVLIAQAIACGPSLLIADEPTASLDTTTQADILKLLSDLRRRLGMALLFITHNPALLAGFADRVLTLYAGRIVEEGPAESVLHDPKHPYLCGLLRSMPPPPDVAHDHRTARLPAILGMPPDLSISMTGCQFEPRCDERMHQCIERAPAMVATAAAHRVTCFKYGG